MMEDIVSLTKKGKIHKGFGGRKPHVQSPRVQMLVPLSFKLDVEKKAQALKMYATDYLDGKIAIATKSEE